MLRVLIGLFGITFGVFVLWLNAWYWSRHLGLSESERRRESQETRDDLAVW